MYAFGSVASVSVPLQSTSYCLKEALVNFQELLEHNALAVLLRLMRRVSGLQCLAVPCSALQCLAVPCSALQCLAVPLQRARCQGVLQVP